MTAFVHNWDSFLYQFVVGGVIFVASIALPFRSGDVRLSCRDDRRTVIALIGCALFYVVVFLAWQFYAITGGGA